MNGYRLRILILNPGSLPILRYLHASAVLQVAIRECCWVQTCAAAGNSCMQLLRGEITRGATKGYNIRIRIVLRRLELFAASNELMAHIILKFACGCRRMRQNAMKVLTSDYLSLAPYILFHALLRLHSRTA